LSSFGRRSLADSVTYLSGNPITRGLAQYGLGLLMVVQRASGGNTTYFLGEVSITAWQKYFPIVYALKEPLAWWILVITVLLSLTLKLKKFDFHLRDAEKWVKNNFVAFAMLLWIAIYWITSIKSNLNIGVRHLLPVYSFTIILISGQIANLHENLKLKIQNSGLKLKYLTFNFLFFILIFSYVFENLRVWPYYLTYFNQIAGGPSGGYRYVVDSNLDWGQDLKRLSKWIDRKKIETIHLDYFGWSDPAYYLGSKLTYLHAGQYKSAEDFLRQNPNGGYLAVSATFFMGSKENIAASYAWLDNYKPITTIGNSIFVWKF
ncbi:MAG: hypothetical protein HYW77_02920, partial [Parcubacteria group bacterium]|nr:hypothetical protein [Parcubacteria group bacterium]